MARGKSGVFPALLVLMPVGLAWGQLSPAGRLPSGVVSRRFPAGKSPVAMKSVDLDRDGQMDLVVADSGGEALLVYSGQPGGRYSGPKRFDAGGAPSALVAGDFNQDGYPDLAVANPATGTIGILLGDGTGGLRAPAVIPAGIHAEAIVAGDFNGDGNLDIAVLSRKDKAVEILPGLGGGSFGNPERVIDGGDPSDLAAADLDGDGRADLVVSGGREGWVTIFAGGGADGKRVLRAIGDAGPVVTGDFNGDSFIDLAVANRDGYDVQVFLGDGQGGFLDPKKHLGLAYPFAITAADFDGDGNLDLALSHPQGNEISILFGSGDGTFKVSKRIPAGTSPLGLGAGLQAEGRRELLVANPDESALRSVIVNTVASGDLVLNGDGQKAMVGHTEYGNQLQVTITDAFTGDSFRVDGIRFQVPTNASWGCVFVPAFNACLTDHTYNTSAGQISVRLFSGNKAGTFNITTTNTTFGNFVTYPETNFNGPPASVSAVFGDSQSAYVGTNFGSVLRGQVLDNYGNPCIDDSSGNAASYGVLFSAPVSAPTANFSGTRQSFAPTDSTATASTPALTAGPGTGAYQVIATSNSPASGAFSLTNVPLPLITTSPGGLVVRIDGSAFSAPQSANGWTIGTNHTIGVDSPQTASGIQYLFQNWSDGGAQSHIVTAPSTATIYTATFKTQYQLTISASPSAGCSVTPTSGGYYDDQSVVQISATANTGYQFTGWTGNVASPNSASTSVTMSGPQSAVANCRAMTTVQTNPTGLQFTVDNGSVQTAPQNLVLSPGLHTLSVPSPQAASGAQNVFVSWSDGQPISHNINVDAPATYTATFKTQYQLTISVSPPGSCTVSPASGNYYDANSPVQISATANSGYRFTGWTGSVADPNNASTIVTMTGPQTVVANCSALTTIQTNPTGLQFSVDGGPLQTAPQSLNLTSGQHTISAATPQPSGSGKQYVFTGWNDSQQASRSINVGSSPVTYTASFKTQYLLTISASPSAGCSVIPTSGGYYDDQSVVQISATANTGYQFTSWTGNVANPNSASTSVTVSGPQTVVANCSALTTIQTNPTGLQFSVDGGPLQIAPQSLNLSSGPHTISAATPQPGGSGKQFVFTGWNDSQQASRSINVGSSPVTYTANFKTQYQLTIAASPSVGGTVAPASGFFDTSTPVPLTASPNPGYQFANWNGAVANPSAASTTISMTGAQTVTAMFVPAAIGIDCASLSFVLALGGAPPPNQICSISNANAGLTASATTQSGNWLSVALDLSATPAILTASILNGNALAEGIYSGSITISGASTLVRISVTLTVVAGTVNLAPPANSFPAVGGTGSTTLTLSPAGATDSWKVVSNQNWISLTSPAGGAGTGSGISIEYTVDANTGAARTASFDVINAVGLVSGSFVINQAAPPCSAQAVSPTNFTYGPSGGSGIVTLAIPGCPLGQPSSAAPWLIPALGNNAIPFTVQPNSGSTRSATIEINGSTQVNVTQTGQNCFYSIATHAGSNSTYPASGGSGMVDVTAPSGCPLPAVGSSDPAFISAGAVQQGTPVTVSYSVSAATAARSGFLNIAGLLYIIRQAAPQNGYNCLVDSGPAPPSLRKEGLSELTGDLLYTCNGQAPSGSTSDFLVTINTTVTNHLVAGDPSRQTTDAVLLLNEVPGQPLVVGTTAFLGLAAGPNSIRFRGVPLLPGSFRLRITNLRADATSTGSNPISAAVTVTGPVPVTMPASQSVGQPSPAITFSKPAPVPGTLAGTTIQPLVFSEAAGQPNAMRPAQGEVGYRNAALGSDVGTATGTRFLVTFSGVPAGVAVFAPTAPSTGRHAQLVSADSNGAGGSPVLGSVTLRGTTFRGYRQVALVGGSGTATWEVTDADPSVVNSLTFNLLIDNPGAAALSSMSIAWGQTGRSFSIAGPVPRFSPSSLPAGGCVSGVTCLSISPSLTTLGIAQTARSTHLISGSNPAQQLAGPNRFDDLRLAIPLVVSNNSVEGASGVDVTAGTDTPNINIMGCASPDLASCLPGSDGITASYNSLGVGQQPTIVIFASASSATYPADGQVQIHGLVGSLNGNRDANGSFTTTVRVPALSVTLSSVTPLIPGQNSTIAVTLSNAAGAGDMPAGGLLEIQFVYPDGVSPGTITGPGWTCNTQTPQIPLCTYTNLLPGGQSSSPLTVNFFINPVGAPQAFSFQARLLLLGGYDLGTFALDTTATTIDTSPSGLKFSLDHGAVQAAPATLYLSRTAHVLSAPDQAGSQGTRYVFSSWSDGGMAEHSVNIETPPATFVASFKTQFQLNLSAQPTIGGSITPASGGYYDSGSSLTIAATPSTGYSFAGWTGGTVTDPANPSTTVRMDSPHTLTANFSSNSPGPSISSLSPNRTNAGGLGFTLTVNGSNFASGSQVRWNGSGRATVFVSATQLQAQIPASDIATGGSATVTVLNPSPGGGTSGGATFTIVASSRCDVNTDGNVTVADVQSLINQVLGLAQAVTDLNRDGLVNVADVQLLVNVVSGNQTCPN